MSYSVKKGSKKQKTKKRTYSKLYDIMTKWSTVYLFTWFKPTIYLYIETAIFSLLKYLRTITLLQFVI